MTSSETTWRRWGYRPVIWIRRWATDTSTIYHIGIVRVCVGMFITACLSMVLGGLLMALNDNHGWSGIAIWTGLMVMLTSMVCVAYRNNRPRAKVSIASVACGIALVAAIFLFVTSAVNLVGVLTSCTQYYPKYDKYLKLGKVPLLAVNAVLLVLSPLQALWCAWAGALTLGHVWSCCRPHTGGIYTISYEEEAEPGGSPDNPYDPEDDLHMDAFDDSQHILKVDRALAVATLVVR